MDAPYFKFYPSDWLSDSSVQFMSLEEEGAYIRLLCYAWNEGDNCGLPDDDKFISRLLKVSTRKWGKLKDILFSGNHAVFEKKSDGLMHNKRLDEEWEKVHQRREKAVMAANSRWSEVSEEDANAMQTQCERIPPSIAQSDSEHMQNDAISEVRSQKSDLDLLRERDLASRELVRAYEETFGIIDCEPKALLDLLQYTDDGMELDLISEAIRKSKVADVPIKYAKKILTNQLRKGIFTVAQSLQETASGARIELTVRNQRGNERGTSQSDPEWDELESKFFS